MKKEKAKTPCINEFDKKIILNIVFRTFIIMFFFWGIFIFTKTNIPSENITLAEFILKIPANERYNVLIFLIPIFIAISIMIESLNFLIINILIEKKVKK